MKKIIITLFFITLLYSCKSSSITSNISKPTIEWLSTDTNLLLYNEPFDFFYANGVYSNDTNSEQEQSRQINKRIKNFNWDSFVVNIEANPSTYRTQSPLVLGKLSRGIVLEFTKDRKIQIVCNNGYKTFDTKQNYTTNLWYNFKIVKVQNKITFYINNKYIDSYQVQLEDYVYQDSPNTSFSTENYSNGVSFLGGIRNVLFAEDEDYLNSLIPEYTSIYNDSNLLFHKKKEDFLNLKKHYIIGLDWENFQMEFEYTPTVSPSQIIIGDKWEIFKLQFRHNSINISSNYGRENLFSKFQFIDYKKNQIIFSIINDVLILKINGEVILKNKFKYKHPDILNRENEIFLFPNNGYSSFNNLKIRNLNSLSTPSVKKETTIGTQTLNNKIDTTNEGLLWASNNIFNSSAPLKDNADYKLINHITKFNLQSFHINFDFKTHSSNGTVFQISYYNSALLDIILKLEKKHLILTSDKKQNFIPTANNTINKEWNHCEIDFHKGKAFIKLNNKLIYNVTTKIRPSYHGINVKTLSMGDDFQGTIKNIKVYEHSKL